MIEINSFYNKVKFYEAVANVAKFIENEINYLITDYRQIGVSDEQEVDWKTGELLWEDAEKTIPKFKKIYGDVKLTDSELSDDTKIMIDAYTKIFEKLAKL